MAIVATFGLTFAILAAVCAGMAIGRLWGRAPLRTCAATGVRCPACPVRGAPDPVGGRRA